MYLRLVQAKAKAPETAGLREAYEQHVIPTLQATPGCLLACLLQGTHASDEVASLTLWETQDDAVDYEKKGTFASLMDRVRPFLVDASEMHVELTKDLTLSYEPTPEEPTVSQFPVSLDLPTKQHERLRGTYPFLRIVSVTLKPDRKDEYHSLYINEVIPALQQANGCLHAYLIMPSRGKHESLSVTIWESRQSAEEYESSGLFAQLLQKVKHTFTDLLQWKLELDPKQRAKAAGTEELKVQGFSVVAMRNFGG